MSDLFRSVFELHVDSNFQTGVLVDSLNYIYIYILQVPCLNYIPEAFRARGAGRKNRSKQAFPGPGDVGSIPGAGQARPRPAAPGHAGGTPEQSKDLVVQSKNGVLIKCT